MKSCLSAALAAMFVVFALPATARGQSDAATVLGRVSDPSGGAVPGATVTLTNLATGITATTVTNATGDFQFLTVRVGAYRLEAELMGFSKAVAPNVTVTVNARQRVDLSLQVGGVGETIEVTGAIKMLETDSSDRGQVISREQVVSLPLNGRAYADLALLSPGVRSSSIATSRDASFNVNGMRSALNNFILDGIDNNSYGTSNQGFSNQVVQVSPDAVEEFKVQTNNFSAEFGRAGGAVINATFRSGTNQFRGTAWEFFRNTALNATGFFRPSSGQKPTLNRNQFGGVFGGPIARDRAFFFLSYEGFRQVQRTLTFSSVPPMAMRQGIMGKPVVNPLTGELYADGVIPASAITPFARKVLDGLPAPTRAGLSNNYDLLPRREDKNNKFDLKFDQQLNPTTSAFVRFSHRKVDNFEPPPIEGVTSSPANAYVEVLNQQIALGVTRTLSSRSLLEIRLGINRTEAGKSAFGTGDPNMLVAYGITGLPTDAVFSGGLTEQAVGGWTTWGRQNSNPQYQNPFVVDTRIGYSWMRGNHTLKTGYEYQRINTEVDDVNPKYGQDTYGGQFSRPAGAAADTATFNLADFLMGARSAYSLVNPFIIELRQRMHFAYIQDDWRATSRLTLNLGLRYEFATPQWDANNKLTNFDPATRTLLQAKDGSIYDRALVNADKNNFGPRLGLAYSIDDKTVLRSAYGLGYVLFNRLGGENLLPFNGPHVVPVSITQQPSQGICSATQAPTTCFRPTQMGYPEGLNVPANFNPLNGRVNYIPPDLKTGEIQSWHVTLQRELGANFVVDVGYVGNKSNHLMVLADLNQARPNAAGENLTLQARRPIQGYQFIQSAFDGGKGDYRALQMKVERRYSRGFYFLNSFTWSRTRDNASGHLETANGDNSRVNFANIDAEFGVSGYDQPYNNVTTAVWEVPFGQDKWWGDWRITAVNTMTSGLPVNLNYSPAANFQVSTVVTHRPNITGEIYADNPSSTQWFNPANIVVPTNSAQPFGNAPRNAARGPALYSMDLGVHKDLNIGSGRRLQFRLETFNVLNRTNLGAPNSNRSNANFGSITTLAIQPRQVQLGVKVDF
jgi:hypothetical protein